MEETNAETADCRSPALVERFKYGVVISECGNCLITSSLQMSISVVKVTRNSQSDGFSVLLSVRHTVKQLTVDLG